MAETTIAERYDNEVLKHFGMEPTPKPQHLGHGIGRTFKSPHFPNVVFDTFNPDITEFRLNPDDVFWYVRAVNMKTGSVEWFKITKKNSKESLNG